MFVVPNKIVFWRGRVSSVEGLKKNKIYENEVLIFLFLIFSCICVFQPGDGFALGSILSNSALFGNTCPYYPDSETGEGVLFPCYMQLYFCLKG